MRLARRPRAADAAGLAELIAAGGVRDPRVLRAIRDVPRSAFVPRSQLERAYEDRALPIGHGQTTSQPTLVARMLEALELSGDEKALEVGTGGGWQTALLARLAREVRSIEVRAELAEPARRNLEAAGVERARVVGGDGSLGLPAEAPFDAIIVAAAHPEVPPALAGQLTPGGRLIAPIGPGGHEDVIVFALDAGGGLRARERVAQARFVRLRRGD